MTDFNEYEWQKKLKRFDPNEPRDRRGRWTDTGRTFGTPLSAATEADIRSEEQLAAVNRAEAARARGRSSSDKAERAGSPQGHLPSAYRDRKGALTQFRSTVEHTKDISPSSHPYGVRFRVPGDRDLSWMRYRNLKDAQAYAARLPDEANASIDKFTLQGPAEMTSHIGVRQLRR